MSMRWFVFLVPIGFLLVMAAGILLPLWYLSSRWSGWEALAARYRASQAFRGTRWLTSGLRMAPVGGKTSVRFPARMGADAGGLYLSAGWWHPPLLIPWSDVSMVSPFGNPSEEAWERLPRSLLRRRWRHRIEVGQDPRVTMHVPIAVADRVARASGRMWPMPWFDQMPPAR